MIDIAVTLDYEIFGDGTGDVRCCMIRPTQDVLEVCSNHGARLTLFFEICEYWAFQEAEKSGRLDRLGYRPSQLMEKQAVAAVQAGHDVQLHPHGQWLSSRYTESGWQLDLDYVQLPRLSRAAISAADIPSIENVLDRGKRELENLLSPWAEDYECIVMRGGGYSLQPFEDVHAAMVKTGFVADTTVFKGGHISRWPQYADFRSAHSDCVPWRIDPVDINRPAGAETNSRIFEVPIFARTVSPLSLIRPSRIRRRIFARSAPNPYGCQGTLTASAVRSGRPAAAMRLLHQLFRPMTVQWDFCYLEPDEMWRFLDHVLKTRDFEHQYIPLVMIGHSKFLKSLVPLASFLKRVTAHEGFRDGCIRFATMREIARKLAAEGCPP